jgi:hypothetical protein
VWLAERGTTGWPSSKLAEYPQDDEVLAAVDADGDGVVEVLSRRGVLGPGGRIELWDPDLRTFWPAGLGCDGCDGDDC